MIAGLLGAARKDAPTQPLIIDPQQSWTADQFLQEAASYAAGLRANNVQRLAIHCADSPQLLALLVAANLVGASVCVLNHDYDCDALVPLLALIDPDLVVTDLTKLATDVPCAALQSLRSEQPMPIVEPIADSEVLVLTSGTTGLPKCARYLWGDLIEQVRSRRSDPDSRWLLAYHMNHFAGLQMLLHALVRRQALVVPASTAVVDMLAVAEQAEVTHISASPTFWRFALAQLQGAAQPLPTLRQITLGSEVVPESLLQTLTQRFPAARVSQVYASTEAGTCFSVSDGRSGLPLSVLDYDASAPVQFRIEEGQLWICSRHGMRGYLGGETLAVDEWRATGDLVEVRDDRIYFLGRESELINVGGVKVHPVRVEEAVAEVDTVKLCRAYGQANAIMGQIVVVDVVVHAGADPAAVEDQVFEACLSLDRHSRPRLVNVVDELAMKNRKLVRAPQEAIDE